MSGLDDFDDDSLDFGDMPARRVALGRGGQRPARRREFNDLRWGFRTSQDLLVGDTTQVNADVIEQLVQLEIYPPRIIGLALTWTPASIDSWNADLGSFTVQWQLFVGVGQGMDTIVQSIGPMTRPFSQKTLFLPSVPVRKLQVGAKLVGTSQQLLPSGTVHLVSTFSAFAAPVALAGLGGSTG